MEDIQYEAEIVGLEPESKTMYVKYTSPGRRELIAAARLPEREEETDYEIHVAAPFGLWLEDERKVFVPQVGHKMVGVIKLSEPVQELPSIPYAAPVVSSPQAPVNVLFDAAPAAPVEPAATTSGFPTRYVPGPFSQPPQAQPSGGRADPQVSL